MIRFQQRLQELMDDAGVSQTKLADATGIRREDINALVNGQRPPRRHELFKLAAHFHLPPATTEGLASQEYQCGTDVGLELASL